MEFLKITWILSFSYVCLNTGLLHFHLFLNTRNERVVSTWTATFSQSVLLLYCWCCLWNINRDVADKSCPAVCIFLLSLSLNPRSPLLSILTEPHVRLINAGNLSNFHLILQLFKPLSPKTPINYFQSSPTSTWSFLMPANINRQLSWKGTWIFLRVVFIHIYIASKDGITEFNHILNYHRNLQLKSVNCSSFKYNWFQHCRVAALKWLVNSSAYMGCLYVTFSYFIAKTEKCKWTSTVLCFAPKLQLHNRCSTCYRPPSLVV